ncbi:YitT family protein [Clostridioides difficile]
MLQSVYGGILSGLGVGVVFRTRSSQGGTDI